MRQPDPDTLKPFAARYVWWKPPDEAVRFPHRVVAQVMDIGDFFDVQRLAELVGEDYLQHVLVNAEAGTFSPRSWAYWHYRLGLSQPGGVPPMPERRVA